MRAVPPNPESEPSDHAHGETQQGRRTTFRAVGQVALLIDAATGLLTAFLPAVGCVSARGVCTLADPVQALFTLLNLAGTGLCMLVFWAASQEHRWRTAVTGTWLLLITYLAWPIMFLVNNTDNAPPPWQVLPAWLLHHLWLFGSLTLLLVSYRGPTLGYTEPAVLGRRSMWVALVLAPMIAIVYLTLWAGGQLGLSGVAVTAQMLAAAALYGLMRRARPIPAAPSWTSIGLILTALALPNQLRKLVTPQPDSPTTLTHPLTELIIALVVVTALAVLHHYTQRRHTPERPRTPSDIRRADTHAD